MSNYVKDASGQVVQIGGNACYYAAAWRADDQRTVRVSPSHSGVSVGMSSASCTG